MDINEIINNGGYILPNPKYNPKKKNGEPATILSPFPENDIDTQIARDILNSTSQHYAIQDASKYSRYGVTPNIINNLDKELVETQSNFDKFKNAALQAVGSEIVLGTLLGITDIVDFFGNIGNVNNDYTNPASEALREAQKSFEEWAPIYADPDKDIFNGGLLDAGWWAKNLPSVASTISLMLPGMGITKGLNIATKALKADKLLGWTRRSLTGLKNFEKLKPAEQIAKYRGLTATQKFINGKGKDMFNDFIETSVNAGMMRIAENYQESRDTYQQMYEQAAERFNSMNDEEFQEYLSRHEELKDIQTKDDAAKKIAKTAADKTFAMDAWNFVFDFMELKALQDVGKLAKNVRQTAKVRKAERIAKQNAAKDLGLAGAEEAKTAKEKAQQAIANWLSDHKNSATPIFAELSEGAEEAINYISQQEGIHLGNLMLENGEKDTQFEERLKSYMTSPQLYESAFWGWMGGILFQSVGGKVKQGFQVADKYASEFGNKNKNKNTGEKSTTWDERWETPTEKRQIAEIDGRVQLATDARNKLDLIDKHENPFEKLEDGKTNKTISSTEEAQALREKVVNDYVTQLTLNAIDAGNYDALIEYLQDERIDALLKQQGIISEDSNSQEIINKVKQTAEKYENNLFVVNSISGAMKGGIPMEYQQIIARDNTMAQLKIEDLDKRIQQYQQSANFHRDVYKDNLAAHGFDGMDLETSIFLVEASQRLGELKAKRRALVEGEDYKKSLEAQESVRFIDRQIDAINKQLNSSEDAVLNAARMLWAHGAATRFEYDLETGTSSVNSTNANFVTFADLFNNAFTTKKREDIKALNEHLGINFELTDDNILSIFGDDGGNGAYKILNEDLEKLYPSAKQVKEERDKVAKGVLKVAPSLHEDYINLSALQFAKIYEESLLNNTTENISRRVQELDNYMNDKRIKAKNKAYEVLDKLEEKYGVDAIMNYLTNGDEIANISSHEKRSLEDASTILALQNEANTSLISDIYFRLLNNKINRARNNNEESQSSTTLNQANPATETSNVDDTLLLISEPEITPKEEEIEPIEVATPTEKRNGKYKLNLGLDDKIEAELVADTDDNNGVHFEEDVDGNTILRFDEDKEFKTLGELSSPTFNSLFDIVDNSTGEEHTREVVENPIIKQEDNKWTVVKKGKAEIKDKTEAKESPVVEEKVETAPIPEISSTGALEQNLPTIDEDTIRSINDQLQKAFGSVNKDPAFTDKSMLEKVQAAVDIIKNNPGFDKEKYEQVLADATQKLLDVIKSRKGVDLDISDIVLHSVLTESVKDGKFVDDYIEAVDKLVKTYAKKYNLPIINGKTYINLANVLRDINSEYNDNTMATLIYEQFVNYVTSSIGQEKYVVTDKNPKHPNFIQDVIKDIKDATANILEEAAVRRVNIYKYIGDNKVKQELAKLRAGSKLDVQLVNNRLILSHNGVTVGDIPVVSVLNDGSYQQVNMGWITTIKEHNGVITSPTMEALVKLFSDAKFNDVLVKLYEYTFNKNLDKAYKAKLQTEIYNILKSNYNNLIKDDADKADVVNFVSSIVAYEDIKGLNSKSKKYAISAIEDLFKKFHESYEMADKIATSIKKGNNTFTITVNKVTEGQINHNNLETNDPERKNYDRMTFINEAIDDAHKNEEDNRTIDIGYVTSNGKEIQCENTTIVRGGLRAGLPYLILSNGTEQEHVMGTSVKFTDNKAKGLAPIVNAINKEFDILINKAHNDTSGTNWNKLTNFLWRLTGSYNSKWNGNTKINGLYTSNVPLFRGLFWSTTGNGNYIHVQNDKFNIQLNANGEFLIITKQLVTDDDGNSYNKTITTKYNIITNEGKDKFKEILSSFKENLTFNIDDSFVRNIPNNTTPLNNKNLPLHIIGPSEFTITIPDSSDDLNPNKRSTFTYNNFKDFVLSTGAIKVDTHVGENGSNFESRGDNQFANQILTINIESSSSSPVEDSEVTVTSNTTDTINVLTDDKINDKAIELVKDDFSEEALNSLKKLNLLPKNIIFDENYNSEQEEDGVIHYTGSNAEANLRTKQVTLGKRWVAMFNETDEFANGNGQYRAQAIRKLIHEQLHLSLNTADKSKYLARIEEIYNDFKDSLNNITNAELKSNIEKYLFAEEDKDVALEEFLVESLTSKELVDYLNSVDATVEKSRLKNNLWQRILKLLNDIFNWNVREGSLREKELYVLQKEINNIEKGITNNEKKTTRRTRKNTDNAVQTEINFDAVPETKVNPQEEQKQEPEQKHQEQPKQEAATFDFGSLFGDVKKDVRGSSITETIKSEHQKEMEQIKKDAIANGTFKKAPNGNKSNLDEPQWLQVRTKAFKEWFGDWINNPSEASKVVDENGEPLVVHRGEERQHKIKKLGYNFFSSDIEYSKQFGKTEDYFLNIKNPLDVRLKYNNDGTAKFVKDNRITKTPREFEISFTNLDNLNLFSSDKDGIMGNDAFTGVFPEIASNGFEYVTFDQNQIKSATDNNGDFSNDRKNTRRSSITERVTFNVPNVDSFVDNLPLAEQSDFLRRIGNAERQMSCR